MQRHWHVPGIGHLGAGLSFPSLQGLSKGTRAWALCSVEDQGTCLWDQAELLLRTTSGEGSSLCLRASASRLSGSP